MRIIDVASEDFIALPGNTHLDTLGMGLGASVDCYVIGPFPSDGSDRYAVLNSDEISRWLAISDIELPGQLIGPSVAGIELVPSVLPDCDADEAPNRCVVVQDRRVLGVFQQGVTTHTRGARSSTRNPQGLIGDFRTASYAWSGRRQRRRNLKQSDGARADRVRRYLNAQLPVRIPLRQEQSLLVSLTFESDDPNALSLTLRKDKTCDVLVQTDDGLELVGPGEARLPVPEDDTPSLFQFRVRGIRPGRARLKVLAFQQGQYLGLVQVETEVSVSERETSPLLVGHHVTLEEGANRHPDLFLLIQEQRSADGQTRLRFRLTAEDSSLGIYFKPFGPITLTGPADGYMAELFADIDRLPLDGPEARAIAEARLEAKGALLFERLIPDDLKTLLWHLHDRIRYLQVLSDEASIPWELCRLQERGPDGINCAGYFAEIFAVTRWLTTRNGAGPTPTLPLSHMALIVPADSGLPATNLEAEALGRLGENGPRVERIEPSFLRLQQVMKEGRHDAWHFAGHGRGRPDYPDLGGIVLADGSLFPAEMISGEVANLGLRRPLVFLNACESAQAAIALTGVGGWAERFINAGAGAFIGSYWQLLDKPAAAFAKAFYDQLLDGVPLGEAARQARLHIREAGDPTWLAYTVYGYPLAGRPEAREID